jgi:nitroreductase
MRYAPYSRSLRLESFWIRPKHGRDPLCYEDPMSARTAPEAVSETGELWDLLEAAHLAPSAHNTQPWRFRVGPARIDVFADIERWLPVADDDRRELHLSLGCAIENLLIAAEHRGLGHQVSFFPRPGRLELVATVRFHAHGARSPQRLSALFDAIGVRQTNHGNYDGRPVDESILAELRRYVTESGIDLYTSSNAAVLDSVGELVEHGDRIAYADPEFRDELSQSIANGALGTPRFVRPIARLAVKHADLGRSIGERNRRRMVGSGAVAVVVSITDDPATRILAGQAVQRVWLLATHLGLAVQPMSQPLEDPRLRRTLGALIGATHACPQHLFRLGYAPREERRSPRRSVMEVVAD